MFHGCHERTRRGSAKRFAYTAHQRCRNRGAAASRYPLRGSPFAERVFENCYEHLTMLHTLRVGRESFVARQPRTPQHALAKLREMAIRSHADREHPIAAVERLIRHD